MIFEFTMLGLSIATLVVLLVHKWYELEKGKLFLSHEWLRKTDAFLHATILTWKRVVVENLVLAFRTILFIIKSVAHAISLKLLARIHGAVMKALETMQGKHVKYPTHKGSVSFFLKNIEADKSQNVGHIHQ